MLISAAHIKAILASASVAQALDAAASFTDQTGRVSGFELYLGPAGQVVVPQVNAGGTLWLTGGQVLRLIDAADEDEVQESEGRLPLLSVHFHPDPGSPVVPSWEELRHFSFLEMAEAARVLAVAKVGMDGIVRMLLMAVAEDRALAIGPEWEGKAARLRQQEEVVQAVEAEGLRAALIELAVEGERLRLLPGSGEQLLRLGPIFLGG